MKRFLRVALVGLAAAFPLAFAQDEADTVEPFVGGGFTVFIPDGGAALTLQGGADNLIGPLALRGSLDIGFSGGTLFGIDLLNYIPSESDLAFYIGGGAKILLSGSTAYNIHAAGGLEYFVDDDIALFAELQPGLNFAPGYNPGFSAALRLGANYHID